MSPSPVNLGRCSFSEILGGEKTWAQLSSQRLAKFEKLKKEMFFEKNRSASQNIELGSLFLVMAFFTAV